MAITRKKFDPDLIVVCIESLVSQDNKIVRRGDRLRATDELVRRAPHLFVEDGSTTEEVNAARSALGTVSP